MNERSHSVGKHWIVSIPGIVAMRSRHCLRGISFGWRSLTWWPANQIDMHRVSLWSLSASMHIQIRAISMKRIRSKRMNSLSRCVYSKHAVCQRSSSRQWKFNSRTCTASYSHGLRITLCGHDIESFTTIIVWISPAMFTQFRQQHNDQANSKTTTIKLTGSAADDRGTTMMMMKKKQPHDYLVALEDAIKMSSLEISKCIYGHCVATDESPPN